MAALVGDRSGSVHSCNDDGPVHSGNAIVSRWPILRTSWRPLPAGGGPDERRTVLFAEIDGPRGAIQVFCTHLNGRFDHSEVRQEQVRLIGAFVDECRPRDYPPILTGDMNAAPDSDEIRILTGRMAVAAPKLVFHDAWEGAGDALWDDVVERQPVCGARPRARAASTTCSRRPSRRPRPCGPGGVIGFDATTAWCRPTYGVVAVRY
jgi:endonuclease/exonuclease/phosphatase family metal-dependent hydrolase